MAGKTPIGLAMEYFGRKPGQGIRDFKAEWDELSETDKAQIASGLTGENPSLTY